MRGRSKASSSFSTIANLCAAYKDHAREYYRTADGEVTEEVRHISLSLRELERLYSATQVRLFTRSSLKLVRRAMIEAGLCRRVVNQRVGRIKRMFRWAVSEDFAPARVFAEIKELPALERGRTSARDLPPIQPVPLEIVEKTLPFLAPPVRAMVRLQVLTGMRPGEAIQMRSLEIDRTRPDGIWIYRPRRHKTAWRGIIREIPLGARAQEIIIPFLNRPADAPLFSPRESVAWWSAQRRAARRSKRFARSKRPEEEPGQRYRPRSIYASMVYVRSIEYACSRARVDQWAPNRIRHLFATTIANEMDLDSASAAMGHKSPNMTAWYARNRLARAIEIAKERG